MNPSITAENGRSRAEFILTTEGYRRPLWWCSMVLQSGEKSAMMVPELCQNKHPEETSWQRRFEWD
jgi:hypothetical protein